MSAAAVAVTLALLVGLVPEQTDQGSRSMIRRISFVQVRAALMGLTVLAMALAGSAACLGLTQVAA